MEDRDSCPRCGSGTPPGSRFCGQCGHSLAVGESRRGASPFTARTPAPEAVETAVTPIPKDARSLSRHDVLHGRFRIEALLGQGGFGTVYRAFDMRLQRTVALKTLPVAGSGVRFEREIQALAALNHPAIVTIFDADQGDGLAWIAMEYVQGEDLLERLQREGMAWDELARIFLQVAGALDHAHGQGVLHRDIKPANILLNEEDAAKVTDFGIARVLDATPITESGVIFGTLEYVAPECLGDAPPDARADLYALGVCMYQALSGDLPISAETPAALLNKVARQAPLPLAEARPDLPAAIHELVDACLRKEPASRPATAREVELTIASILEVRDGRGGRGLPIESPARLSTHALRPEVEGERKRVILLLARERHLADLMEELPADEVNDLRASYLTDLFPVVERFGGKVEEIGEEELLLVFGLPRIAEDDEERALRCAAAIRDEVKEAASRTGHPLRLSVGIHTGYAISSPGAGTYLLRGASVRLARRLADAAREGEVMVSDSVREVVSGRFEFDAAGDISVPGGRDTTGSHKLGAAIEDAPALEVERRWGTIGREAELALLRQAARRALEGGCQVVSITGDAGIGKSHLLNAFLASAGDPSVSGEGPALGVLSVQGFSSTIDFAYRKARDMARSLSATIGGDETGNVPAVEGLTAPESQALRALLDLEEDRRAVPPDPDAFHKTVVLAVGRLLREACGRSPQILVLEDLHWFDAPSVQLVREVIAESAGQMLFVLATCRAGFDSGFGGLRGHQSLALGALEGDQDLELVRRFLDVRDVPADLQALLQERSEGNPLYTLEFLRMARERGLLERKGGEVRLVRPPTESEVPGSLEGILTARVDRLEPDTRRLLQLASVLGREFPLRLLEASSDADDTGSLLASLGRRGILHLMPREGETWVRFDHPLTRDVVYSNILRGRRRQYHRAVGVTLERLYPERSGGILDRLAYHWGRSDDRDKAVGALRDAAARNHARYRFDAALRQYGEAIARAREMPGELPALLLARSAALLWRGDNEGARIDAERAVELAGEDDARLFEARLALGDAIEGLGRREEAAEEYRKAAAHAGGDADRRARALLAEVRMENLLGRPDEALRLLEEVGSLVDTSCEDELVAEYCGSLGWALYDKGKTRSALMEQDRARSIYEKMGQHAKAMRSLYRIGIFLVADGRYGKAVETLREVLEEARGLGHARMCADSLFAIVYTLLERGRLGEAEEALRDLEHWVDVLSNLSNRGDCKRLSGTLGLLRGEYGRARIDLRESKRLKGKSGDRREVFDCDLLLSRLYLECGLPQRALDLAAAVEQAAILSQDPFQHCEAQVSRSAALLCLGDQEQAWSSAEAALQIARKYEEPEILIPALIQRAALQRGADAFELLDEALESAASSERRLDEGRALLERGRALLEAGQVQEAVIDGIQAARIGADTGAVEIAWRGEALAAGALALQGDERGARESRTRASSLLRVVVGRIGDQELAAGYRADPQRAGMLNRSGVQDSAEG